MDIILQIGYGYLSLRCILHTTAGHSHIVNISQAINANIYKLFIYIINNQVQLDKRFFEVLSFSRNRNE